MVFDVTNTVGHTQIVQSYNVADAKTHFSEILDRVSEGEEVMITRRGEPIARLTPARRSPKSILGAGLEDRNVNLDVLSRDEWWKGSSPDDSQDWYE